MIVSPMQPRPGARGPYRSGAAPEAAAAKPGLGDIVEKLVHPIAVALKLPCLEKGKLKPQSPCAKRRDRLNKLGAKLGIGA